MRPHVMRFAVHEVLQGYKNLSLRIALNHRDDPLCSQGS